MDWPGRRRLGVRTRSRTHLRRPVGECFQARTEADRDRADARAARASAGYLVSAATRAPPRVAERSSLLTLMGAAGQRAEALAVFDAVRGRLAEDLGIDTSRRSCASGGERPYRQGPVRRAPPADGSLHAPALRQQDETPDVVRTTDGLEVWSQGGSGPGDEGAGVAMVRPYDCGPGMRLPQAGQCGARWIRGLGTRLDRET
ncbi:BTAD domain-containing putative transcriptional regulator [[Kitasatospora] papulosa]|uniref:BTAD domain-containing putative transcriptional regulator n=1 Tax=[Kitasatospora] papulosa TaxID=1464011 RepID=UPI003673B32E